MQQFALAALLAVSSVALAGCADTSATPDTEPRITQAPPSDSPSTSPTTDDAGGSTSTPSPAPTTVQQHTVSDDDTLTIAESGEYTVTCVDGGAITISAAGAQVWIAGTCEAIAVEGLSNQIAFERADEVVVGGTGNTVTGMSAKTLNVTGNDNVVHAVRVEKVRVEGSGNRITYDAGKVNVKDDGSGNVIERRTG